MIEETAQQVIVSPPPTDRAAWLETLRERALAHNGGNRDWRQRKADDLDAVIQMALRAPRMDLLEADLHGDLNLVYRIHMPTPRFPVGDRLVIAHSTVFHLVYCDEWRMQPPPGYLPVGALEPHDIWAPAARPGFRGALCLGDIHAAAPKELILMAYYLVSLQDLNLDETDTHGVFNVAACEYYRAHPEYLPLTRAGLYEPWTPEGGA
jgi:hypothetical protein